MGKRIDRIAGFALLTAAVFIACMHIFGSIPIACLLSLAVMAALRKLPCFRRAPGMSAFAAQSILERWGFEPDETVRTRIEALPGVKSDPPPVCIVRPLRFSLSRSDIFSQWKNHRGQDRLVIAATCYADANALAFAAALNMPRVEVLDAAKLIPLIRTSSPSPSAGEALSSAYRALRGRFSEMLRRRSVGSHCLKGLLLMGLYLVTGSAAYLALSIAALFLAGASLHLRKT